MRGKEKITYRQGTDTKTDENNFFEMEICKITEPHRIASGQSGFIFPNDTIPSFEAEHNKVIWSLEVVGNIARWAEVNESFPLRVVAPQNQ